MPKDLMPAHKNEIVVYQPNETLRLEVKLEDETVWLTQSQMAELFGCTTRNVRLHLENIYACGELNAEATGKDFFLVRQEGSRRVSRCVTCYNLDAIISVGYRVNSIRGVQFRQWAMRVIKEYLLNGRAVNKDLAEAKKALAEHEKCLSNVELGVETIIHTLMPPIVNRKPIGFNFNLTNGTRK